jgi:hypothetical protein
MSTTGLNVFALAQEFQKIEQFLADCAENGTEPDAQLQIYFDAIEGDFDRKVENIGFLIKNREAVKVGKVAAITSMEKSCEQIDKDVDRLKKMLAALLVATGKKKVPGAYFDISWQNNAPSCDVIDEAEIPAPYWREIPPVPASKAVDKKAILADLKEGVVIPGAKLKQSIRLNIK